MISSVQYQLLKDIQNGKRIDDQKYFNEMVNLRGKGYVTLILGQGYTVNGDWLSAIEEYEHAQISEMRESETIKLAKESNKIAKESNEIANSANKKSHNANVLALFAIIIPSLLSVGALVISILAYLAN